MQSENCVAEKKTIRSRINDLHGLLLEALSIEAEIDGGEPSEKVPTAEAPSAILSTIEQDLEGLLSKARGVLAGLRRIHERL